MASITTRNSAIGHIIAGIESEIETVLVLSGVTAEADLRKFAYRPNLILKTIAEITGNI